MRSIQGLRVEFAAQECFILALSGWVQLASGARGAGFHEIDLALGPGLRHSEAMPYQEGAHLSWGQQSVVGVSVFAFN
jgi:hypothetical protein